LSVRRLVGYSFCLAALVAATLALCLWGWDLAIASLFHGGPAGTAWPLGQAPWSRLLYRTATLPAFVLALSCGLLLCLGLAVPRLRAWRYRFLAVVLTVIIGPWLIGNVILKETWGRPRPKQIAAFGGVRSYLPVWRPGPVKHNSSFPSGHAAMAFGLALGGFLFPRRRVLAGCFVVAGLIFGTLVGLQRLAQGAHFTSDVIWSAALTLGLGLLVFHLGLRAPGREAELRRRHPEYFQGPWTLAPGRERTLGLVAAVMLLLMTAVGLILVRLAPEEVTPVRTGRGEHLQSGIRAGPPPGTNQAGRLDHHHTRPGPAAARPPEGA
jgi:membrane-associated PAP2 superfamily phosphatase